MKLKTLLLVATVAGMSGIGNAASSNVLAKFKNGPHAFCTPTLNQTGFFKSNTIGATPFTATDDETFAVTTPGWGLIKGTDGADWFFSQEVTNDPEDIYSLASSDITIYNQDNEALATITVNVGDGVYVNNISPFGAITNKFFDNDASTWELMVYLHGVNDNHETVGEIRAYNNKGEQVYSVAANNAFFFDGSKDWNVYQRLMVENIVKGVDENDQPTQTMKVDVMKPGGWDSENPIAEHSFEIDFELVNYSNGAYINAFRLGNDIYYVLSHYEKPYFTNDDDMSSDPIPTEDNHYILEIFDKQFSKVSTITTPTTPAQGALYGFRSFGLFSSRDLSKGSFSGDDKFNVVITNEDYVISMDDYIYSFDVYNQDSEKIKTIGTDIKQWAWMADLAGEEQQVALMQSLNGIEQIQMVDLPSCNVATTFPAMVNGILLSTNVNRCKVGDSYQYAFGIGNGDVDENGDVIAKIGWFNKDTSFDHFTKFNLGKGGEYFTPHITGTTLNPYTFVTDDTREYIYIAKIRDAESDQIDNILFIADENGKVLRQYKGNEEIGDLNLVLIYNEAYSPKMLVTFYNLDTKKYTAQFYDLPLEKFTAGGEGTKESPYIITSVGDLQQVESAPKAYYQLGKDIDMSEVMWEPISSFSGNFDGKNFALKNMTINSTTPNVGLFSNMLNESGTDEVIVKNLLFVDPVITANESTSCAGVVAGMVSDATIDSVYVYNPQLISSESTNCSAGTIAGMASLYTEINSCGAYDINIDMPGNTEVGGIAGSARTSTVISASRVNGSIKASASVGGLVGSAQQSTIQNSYADVTIEADNTVGGIVGDATRGLIANSIAKGSISANTPNQWNGYCVGGLIGSLDSDWSQISSSSEEGTEVAPVAKGNVVALSEINTAEAEVAKETVHRIVGRSLIDEDWMEGETPTAEKGLVDNYANAALALNGVEAAGNTTEGANKAIDEMTTEFFEGLGFQYGNAVETPWKGEDIPVLYFDNVTKAISLNANQITLEKGETFTLTATVLGTSADGIEFSVSDDKLISLSAPEIDGNTATVTVTCLESGSATITVTLGNVTTTCGVTAQAGVATVTNETSIRFAGNAVIAEGATSIALYNMQGVLVDSVAGDRMDITVANGFYIAVATDATGKRSVLKIAVR